MAPLFDRIVARRSWVAPILVIFLLGVGVGRSFRSRPVAETNSPTKIERPTETLQVSAQPADTVQAPLSHISSAELDEDDAHETPQDLVVSIKNALARPLNTGGEDDLSESMKSVTEDDARQALRIVESLPDDRRNPALKMLLSIKMPGFRPETAIANVMGLPATFERDSVVAIMVNDWAQRDVAAATQWVQQQPDGSTRDRFIRRLVAVVSETDPKAALELQRSFTARASSEDNYNTIFYYWTKIDLNDAAAVAAQLPLGVERESALRTVGWAMAEQDPEAAFHWASHLPPGQGRNSTLQQIFSCWAKSDPVGAGMAASNLPPGSVRERCISNIARQWSQSEPRSALNWVNALPADESRNQAVRQVFSAWVKIDRSAVANYVTTLPLGKKRTDAMSALSRALADNDLE